MDDTQNDALSIFCTDSVAVTDKLTFCSFLIQGVQMTYWLEESDDANKTINSIFDVLFEEVIANKDKSNNLLINNNLKP